jgi:hypothetical protein
MEYEITIEETNIMIYDSIVRQRVIAVRKKLIDIPRMQTRTFDDVIKRVKKKAIGK